MNAEEYQELFQARFSQERVPGYPKVWALGHIAVMEIFNHGDDIVVQEKIDGSQFSFGMLNGHLKMRSKGADLYYPTNDKLFAMAVDTAAELFHKGLLPEGIIFRGEAVTRRKHNTLQYARIPTGGIILFDASSLDENYGQPSTVSKWAEAFGLEMVPTFYHGPVQKEGLLDRILAWLNQESCLGDEKMEGVVFKNYHRFGRDGKCLMGKYVREDFKEINGANWKGENPGGKDILQIIGEELRTEARWHKSIQHLRDAGKLEFEPRDIGQLIKEIQNDTKEETIDHIKERLFAWAWPQIQRRITAGFPEFYKQWLVKRMIE